MRSVSSVRFGELVTRGCEIKERILGATTLFLTIPHDEVEEGVKRTML